MMVCIAAFRPSTYLSNLFLYLLLIIIQKKGHGISFMRLQNKNVAEIEDKFLHHFKCGFVILEENLLLCTTTKIHNFAPHFTSWIYIYIYRYIHFKLWLFFNENKKNMCQKKKKKKHIHSIIYETQWNTWLVELVEIAYLIYHSSINWIAIQKLKQAL